MQPWSIFARSSTCVLLLLLWSGLSSAPLSADEEPSRLPDCLNLNASAPNSPGHNGKCDTDPLNISSSDQTGVAETALGLTTADLEFDGCPGAIFQTSIARTIPRLVIRISYPSDAEAERSEYVAPIVHELGHAYQLKQAGSFAALENQLNPYHERAELGADFLTGVILRSMPLPTSDFQLNNLVAGSYKLGLVDPHGVPHQRIAAFRQGYFFDPNVKDIAEKYRYFQADLYPTVGTHL